MKRLALALLSLALSLPALAADWQVDPAASRLGFSGTQQGGSFEGRFRDWTAQIRFDPRQPQAGRFDVTVQVASADTGSRERDRYLPSKIWFAAKSFPEARFVSSEFSALGGNRYLARGELSLKGVKRPIELPFSWEGEGETATLRVETTLDRSDFGIGEGDFAGSDVVGHQVKVIGELSLRKAGQ